MKSLSRTVVRGVLTVTALGFAYLFVLYGGQVAFVIPGMLAKATATVAFGRDGGPAETALFVCFGGLFLLSIGVAVSALSWNSHRGPSQRSSS